MNALTAKQGELLSFLKAYSAFHQRMPSFQEMAEELGLASKSGVHRLICSLEERGFIRRLRDRARAIEIIEHPHLPDAATLYTISTRDLAKEARRRGLAVGQFHRASYRVGEETRSHRYFVEMSL